jgi:hypothetical protein
VDVEAQAENGPVEVGGDVEATSGNVKKRKDEEMRHTYSGLLCTVERRGPTNGFSSRCEHAITRIGRGIREAAAVLLLQEEEKRIEMLT